MDNAFMNHELAFQQWCADDMPGMRSATADYLQHLSAADDDMSPRDESLWQHQWDALLRTIYAYEVVGARLTKPGGVLLNIVTGGGKTAVIAATMVWLRLSHGVSRFVVLCPNRIVRDRLEEDFVDGKVFVDRDLIPPGNYITKDDFAPTVLGTDRPRGFANLMGANVIIGNIAQFYQSTHSGQTNLAELMNGANLAVFNDEAHNSPAEKWDEVLDTLKPKVTLRVDTTATPDRADDRVPDSKMIYEYGIQDALSDGIVKSPVVYQPNINTVELTYRDANTGEPRGVDQIDWDEVELLNLKATQWVTDDEPMRQQMAIALRRLEEQRARAKGRYNPVLLVVAVCKLDAQKAQRTLQNHFGVNALLVTEEVGEEDRRAASRLGRVRVRRGETRYDAVVSVLMLREGWDVPEVGVILLLRKFSSQVYGQQVIGRGLRRVRLPGIDEAEPQICAVVDHPKLDHRWLWDIFGSKVREDVGIDDKFEKEEDLPEPPRKQELVNPENIIEIPEPDSEEEPEFEYDGPDDDREPLTNWRDIMAGWQYPVATIEITKVDVDSVGSKELTGEGWETIGGREDDGVAPENGTPVDATRDEMVGHIQEELLRIAGDLLDKHGFAAQFRGSLYRVLLKHVRTKFLAGKSVGLAEGEHLETAHRHLHLVEENVAKTPGLLEGIVFDAD